MEPDENPILTGTDNFGKLRRGAATTFIRTGLRFERLSALQFCDALRGPKYCFRYSR